MISLGIYAWFGYELSLEQRLNMIKQTGFDTTCLWFGAEETLVREGRVDEIPDMVRSIGLELDNIHAPFIDHYLLWSDTQNAIDKVRLELTTALSFCTKHRIPRMVVHFGGKDFPPSSQKGLQVVRNLVKQAEDSDVTIAAENGEGGNEYLEYIFANIHSPNLAFCYDSSHDNISREFRGEALQKWRHLLVTTHLSDNLGIDDDHLLPGRGKINWDAVREHIPVTYKGTLMLEVDGPNAGKGFTPEQFLQTGYEWLKKFALQLEHDNN
jgi:sugar phosphate isomerase/epimerase